MPAAALIDTNGRAAPRAMYSRWRVLHVKSGLEHETKQTAQYAFGALAVAVDEGFASRLLDAGFGFPTMADCEFVELESDAARVDATLGRIA